MATSKNEPSDQKLNRPVRLKDIAEVAGVSILAVSHVLMGTGQETVRAWGRRKPPTSATWRSGCNFIPVTRPSNSAAGRAA